MASHAYTTTPLLRPASAACWPPSPGRLIAPGGPVSATVRADAADRRRIRELRRAIADRIEADLALLDSLDGDADLEPSLGAAEPFDWQDQERWAAGACDDRENAQCVDCDGERIAFVPFVVGRTA